MKIEVGVNPNCSEGVIRFYTLEPKKIQKILQAIVDDVAKYEQQEGEQVQPETVPLLKDVNAYKQYLSKVTDKSIFNDTEIHPGRTKKAFVLNIANNLLRCGDNWIKTVKDMNIKVEEGDANSSNFAKDLERMARDCTCGETFFDGYKPKGR